MIQTKYLEVLKEFRSINLRLSVLVDSLREEQKLTGSPLDSLLTAYVRQAYASAYLKEQDMEKLLQPCRGFAHFWADGVCLKCGEPVDAYAAARKEAR